MGRGLTWSRRKGYNYIQYRVSTGATMAEIKSESDRGKLIHIRLTDEIHKALRIRVAQEEKTIQDWVVAAISKALGSKG